MNNFKWQFKKPYLCSTIMSWFEQTFTKGWIYVTSHFDCEKRWIVFYRVPICWMIELISLNWSYVHYHYTHEFKSENKLFERQLSSSKNSSINLNYPLMNRKKCLFWNIHWFSKVTKFRFSLKLREYLQRLQLVIIFGHIKNSFSLKVNITCIPFLNLTLANSPYLTLTYVKNKFLSATQVKTNLFRFSKPTVLKF